MINDAREKPRINDLEKRSKILNSMPTKVIPIIQITITYNKLIDMLFLKAIRLFISPVLTLSINNLILSTTRVLSLKPMMLAKTAPRINPRKSMPIMK